MSECYLLISALGADVTAESGSGKSLSHVEVESQEISAEEREVNIKVKDVGSWWQLPERRHEKLSVLRTNRGLGLNANIQLGWQIKAERLPVVIA